MMRQFGITCNGAAVTTVDQIESVAGALDPAAPVEIRCPTMFPETSIECRDLLSALGFGAFTIEVRGYLFTAVHGFIPNMERWRRACGSNRVPARSTDGVQSADRTPSADCAVDGRILISSRGCSLNAGELIQAIARARATALKRRARAIGSEIPARISSGHATALDAATWSALTIITQ